MNKITIKNVKGVKELTFEIPTQKGIYLLTGLNGCGKTTLLVALSRIYDKNAFSNHLKVGGAVGLDANPNGQFIYEINGQKVTYNHKNKQWSPQPRSQSKLLANSNLFDKIVYITTAGARAYMQEPKEVVARPAYSNVSDTFKNAMNSILDTNIFDNLKFVTVDMKRKRRIPHRENKLYSVTVAGRPTYTERNFSLGERFLLNMMDIIDNIPNNSMLLVDELELALHPSAQIRFYDYLKQAAEDKSLVILVSTHSASLIRHADKIFFLESHSGMIEVLDDCYPAYILKDLSPWEEKKPDYIFFVEDVQARAYLREIIKEYQRVEQDRAEICIMPVAGKKQTVQYMLNNVNVAAYTLRNMQCFPDADVETELNQNIANYATLKPSTKAYTDMMVANASNITYLDITPEIGLWNQIKTDGNFLESELLNINHGNPLPQSIANLVAQVIVEETGKNENSASKKAKFSMKNLVEKISVMMIFTDDHCWRVIWSAYVQYKVTTPNYYDSWKSKIDAILSR